MANEVRLIDANSLMKTVQANDYMLCSLTNSTDRGMFTSGIQQAVDEQPTIDPESLRPKGRYNAHEVAEIIAELFGDCCACNFNGIDEWLPFKCELVDACPNTVGVACWEQYLKYRDTKMEG